ncbi:MAG: DUF4912 domain-containing protein [Treponema sp.]|jgi:hypothetical protein|nr:DUF4912 domain-containing protein [Treponema sp.]
MVKEASLDRPFLESLTTAELIKLADRAGIDVPPGLERIVIIGELLEALDNAGEGSEQKPPFAPEERRHLTASAPFPNHYNITYVNVLVRDPLWAFAFWEINDHDRELHEKAPDFGGYCLKVEEGLWSEAAGPRDKAAGDSSFTVQVGIGDSAWYLGFSPSAGTFRVELCVLRREESVILAVSKPFSLPNLHEPLGNRYSRASHNPLLRLSGIDEFKILHNTSRSSRLPKHSAERANPLFDAGTAGGRE